MLWLVAELVKVDSMRWWTNGSENERIECRKELRQINWRAVPLLFRWVGERAKKDVRPGNPGAGLGDRSCR